MKRVRMCKIMEDMRNESVILSAIDTARFYGVDDEKILKDIIKRFGLTESVAKDYLLRATA